MAVILLMTLLIGMLIQPTKANAQGSGFGAFPGTGQHGQGIGIFQGSPDASAACPDASVQWTVEAVLTDSANNQWITPVATTDSQGSWYNNAGVMIIDQNAAIGEGTLTLRCVASGHTTAYPYTTIWFGVTEQSNKMTIDQAMVGQTATLSSLPGNGCSTWSGDGVSVFVYGKTKNSSLEGLVRIDTLTADASTVDGSWSVDIPLDPGKYTAGADYYAIVECLYMSNFYTSFKFDAGRSYVAMGDSYSSGEGALNYYTDSGDCHRSLYSYPVYLRTMNGLFNSAFAACSGAVSDDLYNQNTVNTSEAAQLSHLNDSTDIVTLTIGGNDVDFAGIMDACVSRQGHSGDDCRLNSTITTNLANRMSALAGTSQSPVTTSGGRSIHSIENILSDIATEAPHAKIYIAGYPELFGASTSDYTSASSAPGGYKCVVNQAGSASVSYADAQWLNSKTSQLNDVIEDAVESLPQLDVTYVPPTPFDGHGLCDSSGSYILGAIIDLYTLSPTSESFHPNRTGMEDGYGAAFSPLIN